MARLLLLRAIALFLTLQLPLPWVAASELVACRMTGRMRTTCCCAQKRPPPHVHRTQGAEVRGRACCQVERLDAHAAPTAQPERLVVAVMAPPLAVELSPTPPPAAPVVLPGRVSARSRAPPSGWPPLFITHRALLS